MFGDLFQQTRTSKHQCIRCQSMIKNVLALGNVFSVHREAFKCILRMSPFNWVLWIVKPLTQCFKLCQLHIAKQGVSITIPMTEQERRRWRWRCRRGNQSWERFSNRIRCWSIYLGFLNRFLQFVFLGWDDFCIFHFMRLVKIAYINMLPLFNFFFLFFSWKAV
jgi:hypothetical protein